MKAPSMEHPAIFLPRILADLGGIFGIMCFSWLQLLAHILRRINFNPQHADHAARIQLGAVIRCTTPSKTIPHFPLVQTKEKGRTKNLSIAAFSNIKKRDGR